jgi:hypothetical protein
VTVSLDPLAKPSQKEKHDGERMSSRTGPWSDRTAEELARLPALVIGFTAAQWRSMRAAEKAARSKGEERRARSDEALGRQGPHT